MLIFERGEFGGELGDFLIKPPALNRRVLDTFADVLCRTTFLDLCEFPSLRENTQCGLCVEGYIKVYMSCLVVAKKPLWRLVD